MPEPAAANGLIGLYHQHRGEILRFLIARTGDREEADDIIQDLWVKLAAGLPGPVANGRSYLFRMAQNLVLDRVRERRRRERREKLWSDEQIGVPEHGLELADSARSADEQLLDKQENARLAAAIAGLPDGARRAFCLHKIDGLSHAEVAMRLGISKSGVEKHMAVAMKYLRRVLMTAAQDT